MAVRIVDLPIKELLKETALTVAGSAGPRNVYLVRHGFREILIEPAAAMHLAFAPRIQALWFYDNSAATKWVNLLDGSKSLVNRHVAGDSGATLDAMQTADFIYAGCFDPFLGVWVDMDGTSKNANAATIAGGYSKNNDTFAALSLGTDGTASGGATLAQDGILPWTVPTDWGKFSLATVLADSAAPTWQLHWVRLSVSAALSADVEMEQIAALATPVLAAAAIGAGIWLKASTEYTIPISDDVGALETLAQGAGATTVNVTWIKR